MIYVNLPAGATVLVDATVFIHHFEPNLLFGPAATTFADPDFDREPGITRYAPG
jgi:hypothetical protein